MISVEVAKKIRQFENQIKELVTYTKEDGSDYFTLVYDKKKQDALIDLINKIIAEVGTYQNNFESEYYLAEEKGVLKYKDDTGTEKQVLELGPQGSKLESRIKGALSRSDYLTCIRMVGIINKVAHDVLDPYEAENEADKLAKQLASLTPGYFGYDSNGNEIKPTLDKSFIRDVDTVIKDKFKQIQGRMVGIGYRDTDGTKKYNYKNYKDLSSEDLLAFINQLDSRMAIIKRREDFITSLETSIPIAIKNGSITIKKGQRVEIKTLSDLQKAIASKKKNLLQLKRQCLEEMFGVTISATTEPAITNEINQKYNQIKSSILDDLKFCYVVRRHNDMREIKKSQDHIFRTKNTFISIIAQMIGSGVIKGIRCKLINATPRRGASSGKTINGFDYMLEIDDPALAYFVEVHMPNFLSNAISKLKWFKKENQKSARGPKGTGATAVYERTNEEIERAREGLEDDKYKPGELRIKDERHGIGKATAIARGSSNPSLNPKVGTPDNFKYNTTRIGDSNNVFSKYLIDVVSSSKKPSKISMSKSDYDRVLYENESILANENVSISISLNAVCENYYEFYSKFNDEEKKEFVSFALNEFQKGDAFDKELYAIMMYGNLKLDEMAKLAINSVRLKEQLVNDLSHDKEYLEYYMNDSDYIKDKIFKKIKRYMNKEYNIMEEEDYDYGKGRSR